MNIKIIYDEDKAIREKAETDAHNKRLRRPVKILAIITLGIILLAITTNILSNFNRIHQVYAGLTIVVAAFLVVALWILWGIKNEQELLYSANVRYYIATKGKTVKSHYIDRRSGGGPAGWFSWPCLDVWVEEKRKINASKFPLTVKGTRKASPKTRLTLLPIAGTIPAIKWTENTNSTS